MKRELMLQNLAELFNPVIEELGCELYHLEYVKENNEYYLRIYIDKTSGVSLQDCENVSRRISDILDVEDPIQEAYYLEVSSPGLNRTLFTEAHMRRYIGSEVQVKLNKSINGKKTIVGILGDVSTDSITIDGLEEKINIPKDKIKSVNLEGEI